MLFSQFLLQRRYLIKFAKNTDVRGAIVFAVDDVNAVIGVDVAVGGAAAADEGNAGRPLGVALVKVQQVVVVVRVAVELRHHRVLKPE